MNRLYLHLIFALQTIKKLFLYLIQGKINKLTISNIKGYFQGNLRMINIICGLSENEIQEQFYWRLTKMNPECIKNKQCPCQCECPEKQLEDRPCELNCYPELKTNKQWEVFKLLNNIGKQELEVIKSKGLNIIKSLNN